jgi:hypothetical protein
MTQPTITSSAAEVAGYLKQWMFDPNHPHHPLRAKLNFNGPADRNTNLKNSRTRKFLQWEEQTFGINLGWTSDAEPTTAVRVSRWFFTRLADDSSPIRYGQSVALGYGISPSYIYYEERTFGINLNWSSTPRFDWKLLGGKSGQEVRSGDWLALYNQTARDCLIYFDRTVGGDIGWPSSETWTDQIEDAVMQAIKDHWKEAVAYLLSE